jgi:hypothetical protein
LAVLRIAAFLALIGSLGVSWAQLELTPSTSQLSVSKYIYFNPGTRAWERYSAVGFYEPQVGNVKPRIQLLPRFNIRSTSYISRTGTTLTAAQAGPENTRAVGISLKYEGDIPNALQQRGVLGEVFADPIEYEVPPTNVFTFAGPGQPFSFLDSVVSNPNDRTGLENRLRQFREHSGRREQLAARWNQVNVRVAAIQSVRFILLVDGVTVDERQIPSTVISANGVLPDLFVNELDEYRLNRIKEGAYQVLVEFSFLDAHLSSINANFQLDRVMHQLVEESRKMTASAKRSGVQILGFGSRKTKIHQALREQSREQIAQDSKAGTTIEMRDVSPTILAMFESKFFPALSKAQVIAEHLAAAQVAESAGNTALMKAHQGYAEALQKNDLELSVDTDAALKALNQRDYATFLAKGVSMGRTRSSESADYARVLTRDIKESTGIEWTAIQATSTHRVVTQFLQRVSEEYVASVGICDAVTYGAQTANGIVHGFIPLCVIVGGPASTAGIRPGEFLGRVNGNVIRSEGELRAIIDQASPGDDLEFERLIWQPSPFPPYGSFNRTPIAVRAIGAPKP